MLIIYPCEYYKASKKVETTSYLKQLGSEAAIKEQILLVNELSLTIDTGTY